MNQKSYELQCLDYACIKTIQKGGNYNSIAHISNSIEKLMLEGYTLGFTNNDDARKYIQELDSDTIEKELILNLIKQKACEKYYGIEVICETRKTFDDKITNKEAGILMYNVLKENGMESLKWILNKYHKLYLDLSTLFAETRYFNNNYTIDRLDDSVICENIDNYLINQVEQYYEQISNEFSGVGR